MPPTKAAPKKAAPKKASKKEAPTSAEVTVFVPKGQVRKDEILRAALLAASSNIPMAAMNVKPEVTAASDLKKTEDGEEGRDYTVVISWTPRPTRASTADEEAEIPGTVDRVLESYAPLTAERIGQVVDTGTEA